MAGFGKAGHIGRDHEGSRDLQETLELVRLGELLSSAQISLLMLFLDILQWLEVSR